jgi:hypothetical protein
VWTIAVGFGPAASVSQKSGCVPIFSSVGFLLYVIATGKVVARRSWTAIPMPFVATMPNCRKDREEILLPQALCCDLIDKQALEIADLSGVDADRSFQIGRMPCIRSPQNSR